MDIGCEVQVSLWVTSPIEDVWEHLYDKCKASHLCVCVHMPSLTVRPKCPHGM